MLVRSILRSIPLAFLVAASCGKGKVGKTVQPDTMTGADALGEGSFDCTAVAPSAEPLVVDWPDHHRADLGITLQQGGVAVVHYGCDGLELLKHCTIDGGYRYAGSQLLLGVVELESADAVQASLPVQGATFAAKVGGDSKIDIATAIIGRLNTLVSGPSRAELQGECEGATHYVRSAYVGAFSMATGTKGEAYVAAEIFKAGASAGSSSSRSALTKDGDLSVCESHDPNSPAPPSQCRSAVRLELYPIEEAVASGDAESNPDGSVSTSASAQPKPVVEGLVNTCADGFVPAGGKCARKEAVVAYRCDRNDYEDCKAQCDKGSADSCYNAGLGPLSRMPVAPNSPDYAARQKEDLPYYEKACEGGVGLACNSLGLSYSSKNSGLLDLAKAQAKLERACSALMTGAACLHLANLVVEGKAPINKDPKRAVELMERACILGIANGCVRVGEWKITGHKGVPKDVAKGTELLEASCKEAKDRFSCETLLGLHRRGKDLPRDANVIKELTLRVCAMGSADKACK